MKGSEPVTEVSDLYDRWLKFADEWRLELSISSGVWLDPHEPDDVIVPLDCTIHLNKFEDDMPGRSVNAGTITAYLIPDHHSGFSKFSILDAHSSDLAEFLELFDEYRLSDALRDQFEFFGSQLLILDRARISRRFRGVGLGLVAVKRLAESFVDTGLIAYKPFPLQYTNNGDQPGYAKALRKIERYWARLGAEPVAAAPHLWALGVECGLLSIEQMLRPQIPKTHIQHHLGQLEGRPN